MGMVNLLTTPLDNGQRHTFFYFHDNVTTDFPSHRGGFLY